MATRSASTGVLVTLVIFVMLTIALLVTSLLQWTQVKSLSTDLQKERSRTNPIGTPSELETDDVGRLRQGAAAANRNLVPYLVDLNQQLSAQLTGDRTKVLDDKSLADALKALQVADGSSVNALVQQLRNDLNTAQSQLASLVQSSKRAQEELAAASAGAGTPQSSELLAKAAKTLEELNQAAEAYRAEAAGLQQSMATAQQDFARIVNEVTDDRNTTVDGLKAESANLQTQLAQAQRKLSQFETGLQNPALLVDGKILDANAGDGLVYIDIGREQRLQPGTTFEVFESAEQIRDAGQSGFRGKASLQVMKVDGIMSSARVIRSTPGRTLVTGDVLANAVYSPNHRYRFLVHGKFDTDDDGISSADETASIVYRIREWGGTVSPEDRVTGDLDFVVIGDRPPEPAPLSPSAEPPEVAAYQDAKLSRDLYDKILEDANRARIPVLNWNRFQSLTGMTD